MGSRKCVKILDRHGYRMVAWESRSQWSRLIKAAPAGDLAKCRR